MKLSEITVGTKMVDKHTGPCVATSKPRHIAGGYVVDVKSPSPFKGETDLRWTACVENLRT